MPATISRINRVGCQGGSKVFPSHILDNRHTHQAAHTGAYGFGGIYIDTPHATVDGRNAYGVTTADDGAEVTGVLDVVADHDELWLGRDRNCRPLRHCHHPLGRGGVASGFDDLGTRGVDGTGALRQGLHQCIARHGGGELVGIIEHKYGSSPTR